MDKDILIKNQFQKLPLNMQRVISNSSWKKDVLEISHNYNLNPKQTAALYTEVLLLIYQLQSGDDFYDNLLRELEISEELGGKIFDSISTQIISKLEREYEKNLTQNTSRETNSKDKEKIDSSSDEWKRPQLASLPNYSDYEQGKDPYREPIE